MMEIVHKLAPDADLAFANGYDGGAPQLAQNIRDLAEVYRCRIVVDDVTFPNESIFQDGVVSRAVNDVVSAGVVYISAAGNNGNVRQKTSGTWEGDFHDAGPDSRFPDPGRLHGFAKVTSTGTTYETFVTLRSLSPAISLYWSDPWYSSSGTPNKYILYIVANRGGKDYLLKSDNNILPWQTLAPIDDQGQLGQSTNGHTFDAQGRELFFQPGDKIYILRADGSDDRYLHLTTSRGTIDVEIGTDGSIRGHNAALNAISVGAVPVPNPIGPFTGASNLRAESQESSGPRTMFMNPDNSPISPGVFTRGKWTPANTAKGLLHKPDVAGASNVVTTLPDKTLSGTTTGLNPFGGSSAAAPHIAGIVALLLSYRPNLTPPQVKEILMSSAVDVEDPGWDPVSGYGIPMADRVLALPDAIVQPVDASFNTAARIGDWDFCCMTLALQPDGKVVMGGYTSTTPGSITRYNGDGSADAHINLAGDGARTETFQIAVLPDGQILALKNKGIWGNRQVVRLTALGLQDPSFSQATPNPPTGFSASFVNDVQAFAPHDDKIVVASGTSVWRLNHNGSLDPAFATGKAFAGELIFESRSPVTRILFIKAIKAVVAQPDGKVVVAGAFTRIDGQSRSFVARLNSNGSLDTSFNPSLPGAVSAIARQPDGKLLVAVVTQSLAIGPISRLARLNIDGSNDPSFHADVLGIVHVILVQRDGRSIVGGHDLRIGGEPARAIARLFADGTLDRTFTVNPTSQTATGPDGVRPVVKALVSYPAGERMLIGGEFDTVNGRPHVNVARVKTP